MTDPIELRAGDVRVSKDWQAAPAGTLVRIGARGGPVIGMICSVSPEGPPGLLVLEGESKGQIWDSAYLSSRPAVDIGTLFEICVRDPLPVQGPKHRTPGKPYWITGDPRPGAT